MAKRKKQNNYGKKAFYIIIALIALFIIGFEAYRMVSSYIIKRASDKQWPQHDLLPVVDVEDDGTKGMRRDEIQLSLKTFCKLCKTYYGHTPIIYCSESYFKDYLSPEFDGYYLWIASSTMSQYCQANLTMTSGSSAVTAEYQEYGIGWI